MKLKLFDGEVVQGLAFDAEFFDTKRKVKNWVERNNYVFGWKREPIRKSGNFFRVRQKDPRKFITGSYREFNDGKIIFIIGRLKKE